MMRSLLVAALFVHAEAQTPETVDTPQNVTSPDSADEKELQQQAEFGQKMRNKYLKTYAGQYAFPGHNDTFYANGSMTAESQEWYKNYFQNKYGTGSSGSWGSGGSSGGFDYQKYMDEFTGNNSFAGDYMEKYASQYMPPQGNSSGAADFKDYFMNKFGMGGPATALAEAQTPESVAVPQNVTSSNASAQEKELQQQAVFGNKMRGKYMKEYAGDYAFPVHNDTFDANGSMTPESQAWYKNYFKNKYGSIGSSDSGSNPSYQRFMDGFTGNSNISENYMDKYASHYLNKFGLGGMATALASPAERGTSPWVLVLCAFAGASIPAAFAAAWRRHRVESSEEESSGFLLMA